MNERAHEFDKLLQTEIRKRRCSYRKQSLSINEFMRKYNNSSYNGRVCTDRVHSQNSMTVVKL
jgi:hypothetical protein